MDNNVHLIIDPSQQTQNHYINSKLTEEQVMGMLGLLINEIGASKFNTYLLDTGTLSGNIAESNRLYKLIKTSNPSTIVLHLAVHSNAFNNKNRGSLGLSISAEGKLFIEAIQSEVAKITPTIDEGTRKGEGLAALTQTDAIAGLIEVAYHDNEEDKLFILKNLYLLAEAIISGTEKYIAGKIKPEVKTDYKIIGTTHVIELDPMSLKISVHDMAANKIPLKNMVTPGFITWEAIFLNGIKTKKVKAIPVSILASEGKIICNRQPHVGFGGIKYPAGTLIVYKDGTVAVKSITDLNNEVNVWFAVGGCSILPQIRMKEEGFCIRKCLDGKIRDFSDIGRTTNRPVIGYNPTTNKVIIAVRADSNIARGRQTLLNLGCTIGITGDGGGSTVLKVDNKTLVSTTRQLFSIITWV